MKFHELGSCGSIMLLRYITNDGIFRIHMHIIQEQCHDSSLVKLTFVAMNLYADSAWLSKFLLALQFRDVLFQAISHRSSPA